MRLKPETLDAHRQRTNWQDADCKTLTTDEVAWKLYESARTKAAQRGLEFDLKYYDVLRLVQHGKCVRTGIQFDLRCKPHRGPDLPFRASLDRVDNTRGYFADNIQVVVKIYNHAKWTWGEADVLAMARGIISQARG